MALCSRYKHCVQWKSGAISDFLSTYARRCLEHFYWFSYEEYCSVLSHIPFGELLSYKALYYLFQNTFICPSKQFKKYHMKKL